MVVVPLVVPVQGTPLVDTTVFALPFALHSNTVIHSKLHHIHGRKVSYYPCSANGNDVCFRHPSMDFVYGKMCRLKDIIRRTLNKYVRQ